MYDAQKKITLDLSVFPDSIKSCLAGAAIYDASFSPRAKTYFIDKDKGYYLKIAPKDTIKSSMEMTKYFADKGFTSKVCAYESDDVNDMMLMERVAGLNCIEQIHLDNPKKMCDAVSESLRRLHDTDCTGCPYIGVTSRLIPIAHEKYKSGIYDSWLLEYVGIATPQEGCTRLCETEHLLLEDTHIHGDACLPNIMLDDFRFSGFIDFEGGGIGDRHHDLLWTIWSLQHNLKTNAYKERFLDGYGRDKFDKDRYTLCGILNAFTYSDD